MASQTISFVKTHLAEVIDSVRDSHEPVVITQNGAPTAVVQSVDSWERTQRTLALLKLLAMGEAEVDQGRTAPQEEVFKSARACLTAWTSAKRGGRKA